MAASIVRAGAMITRALDRHRCETIADGAFVQENGIIAEVATYEALARRFPRLPVHGTADDVAVPGFVNAHHHVGLTPFQLGAPELPLELWAIARMGARDVDPYLDTLYSAFELIASGVTTVQHIHDTAEGSLADVKARLDAVIRAYRDIGMRASVSYGIADQNHFVHGDNATFLAALPTELATALAGMLDRIEAGLEGGIELFRSLHAEHAGDRRIRVQLAPANLHWCSDAALRLIAETAVRYDAPVHMHLLETPFQRRYAQSRFGTSAFSYLQRFGLPGPRLTIGHGVWLSPQDVEDVARTGTSVCLNCSSNLRLRSGRAPLNALDAAGVNTAIGIDEAGLNDDRDMLQEMRLLRAVSGDPGARWSSPGVGQILRMATVGGAATTGFAGAIGAIEPGMAADVTLFDWQALRDPYVDAEQPAADVLLRRARSRHVRLVMCDGAVIYADGVFRMIDRDCVLAELRRLMQRRLTPGEMKRREAAKALMPHVRHWFGFADDTP